MWESMEAMREESHRAGVALGMERGMERGMAQGMERGMAEGAGRLARTKFGPATAERLMAALETADATRITEVFDAVSECDSASELLVRIGEA